MDVVETHIPEMNEDPFYQAFVAEGKENLSQYLQTEFVSQKVKRRAYPAHTSDLLSYVFSNGTQQIERTESVQPRYLTNCELNALYSEKDEEQFTDEENLFYKVKEQKDIQDSIYGEINDAVLLKGSGIKAANRTITPDCELQSKVNYEFINKKYDCAESRYEDSFFSDPYVILSITVFGIVLVITAIIIPVLPRKAAKHKNEAKK